MLVGVLILCHSCCLSRLFSFSQLTFTRVDEQNFMWFSFSSSRHENIKLIIVVYWLYCLSAARRSMHVAVVLVDHLLFCSPCTIAIVSVPAFAFIQSQLFCASGHNWTWNSRVQSSESLPSARCIGSCSAQQVLVLSMQLAIVNQVFTTSHFACCAYSFINSSETFLINRPSFSYFCAHASLTCRSRELERCGSAARRACESILYLGLSQKMYSAVSNCFYKCPFYMAKYYTKYPTCHLAQKHGYWASSQSRVVKNTIQFVGF